MINNLIYYNMKQYLDLLKNVNFNGDHKPDAREGLPGTKSLFGPQIEFDLREGFPIVTTKDVSFHNIVVELLWFLRGESNIKYLLDHNVNIWNEDAYNYFKKLFPDSNATLAEFIGRVRAGYVRKGSTYKYGDTGNQYPRTWRNFGGGEVGEDLSMKGTDQISRVLNTLKYQPNGRRHLVSSIDVTGQDDLALYWCHALFQFNCRKLTFWERAGLVYQPGAISTSGDLSLVAEELDEDDVENYYLDCKLYQRSADIILGVPYNISSYALLLEIFGKLLNYVPCKFIHSFGDLHLYYNHQDAADTQLRREPLPLPKLIFSVEFKALVDEFRKGITTFDEFISELEPGMFSLLSYEHHKAIKATLNTGMKK